MGGSYTEQSSSPMYVAIGRGSMQSREGPDTSANQSVNKETGEARQLLSSSLCLIHLQLSLNSERPRQHADLTSTSYCTYATPCYAHTLAKALAPQCLSVSMLKSMMLVKVKVQCWLVGE